MSKVGNFVNNLFKTETYKRIFRRSVINGRFVSKKYVDENPSTTITEEREVKK